MDEGMADEIRSYNSQCASQIKAMHEMRRPFTEILADLQKRFVSLENAIDPRKPGTPAHTCGQYLDSFLRKQMDEALKQRERLEKNLRQTKRRIEGRQDLSEEEKRTALERADKRRLLGERDLSLREIDSELIPEPYRQRATWSFWPSGGRTVARGCRTTSCARLSTRYSCTPRRKPARAYS